VRLALTQGMTFKSFSVGEYTLAHRKAQSLQVPLALPLPQGKTQIVAGAAGTTATTTVHNLYFIFTFILIPRKMAQKDY